MNTDYQNTGFTRISQPFSDGQANTLRGALNEWRHLTQPDRGPYGILKHNLWRELKPFHDALFEGSLARIAAQILNTTEVILFQDNIIWKPPNTADRVQWHQDYAYWPLSAPDGVTFWLALDDAHPKNGCLHYIPGSHHLGERQPTNFITPGAASWRQDLPPLDWQRHQHRAVSAPIPAGALLAHHPLAWHMSPGNHTPTQRRAWSLTWIAPTVRWATTHAPHPFNYSLAPNDGDPLRGPLFPRFTSHGAAI